jgi:predicted DNA-binding transcriptional regulator AlpA
MNRTDADFIPVEQLSQLTSLAVNTLYGQYQRKRGPLAGILCKLGNRRLGCWRADYDLWVASQRRLKSPTEQRTAA